MRIAIDISQIPYGTGVSTYTKNLVDNLLADRENEYVPFAGAYRRREEILEAFPGAKVFPLPPSAADFIWNRLHVFQIENFIGKVDVVHTSDWTEPPSKVFKVTTVHDLYPLKFPKLVDPKIREVHKRKLYWVKKETKRIITPSVSTKNDLVALGFDEGIIRVIPEAPTLSRPPENLIAEVKKKYELHDDYVISIGATPLKNTRRIIKAFRMSTAGKRIKLVIVGRPSNIKLDEERNVRFLGHIPQDDLAALLSGSRGLVFASLYEGFGIPILDAFNCGVPVVTSNTGSMPEVAGNAAELVDPESADSIAEGIAKIIRGGKGLVDKGTARVKKFSWEKTANETIKVYGESKE